MSGGWYSTEYEVLPNDAEWSGHTGVSKEIFAKHREAIEAQCAARNFHLNITNIATWRRTAEKLQEENTDLKELLTIAQRDREQLLKMLRKYTSEAPHD
jgi:hypothetical protein